MCIFMLLYDLVSSTQALNPFLSLFAQLNIAYPSTGCQKVIEVEDEKKLYVVSQMMNSIENRCFVSRFQPRFL